MISITGKVISGYGVASGKGKDNRYPEGTLKLQIPFFKERGLDLSAFFIGTINIDISPYQFSIKKYKYYFKEINWYGHSKATLFGQKVRNNSYQPVVALRKI